MKISIYTKVFVALLLVGMGIYFFQIANAEEKKVTTVYIEAWRDPKDVHLTEKKVDIAFVAFAKIDGTNLYFHKDVTANNQIKENIKQLKANNQGTKMVLAVGGYGVDGFSDAAMDGNRYLFTENIISMVKELDLDGVDIDWEYPAFDAWKTQKARPEDTKNFTSLMRELREKLNRLPHKNKSKYLLTFASGTQDWYFKNVEVKQVEKYVDYINVMSYDMTGRWSDTTGFNSNLYIDKQNKSKLSIDKVITKYLEHDIDSKKLLLGVPAYSYGWKGVKSKKDGLFELGKPIDIVKTDLSYKTLMDKYMNKKGFKRYFDEKAQAAYLYDGDIFISYEDKEALKAKVAYIKQKDLAGAMVWEYSQDADDGIVKYLSENLNKE
ncbi:glycosyl hydrolase family 18 protein [Paenibacillus sp. ACRRX]|uniref:glycoside hydrolase family 18 protein n=1 Tax=unclassified Paenibacillus TaxID=185978 RepID=UPI001EF53B37|nr:MULTISPECIES: glycosyl hydrolase family 18 protein [unclassified Paenibacillus]MCG7406147.1 glycosyl hydrolase family 18 protein [Paenibacillus sp. ACRRX]MDK8182601.1 glycosyl hydrolase family 18 protein [Paenibacillus sp. UMB4589-SE434]